MPAPVDGVVAEGPGDDELATQEHHGVQGLCCAVHLLEGHAASNVPHNSTVQPWGGGGEGGVQCVGASVFHMFVNIDYLTTPVY